MIHITFNSLLCGTLKLKCLNHPSLDDVFMLFLPLEIGNIVTPENSKSNEVLYSILSGENAYNKFLGDLKNNYSKISSLNKDEEICFWVDFNDVKQHLNFAYFIKVFSEFKNKFFVEYDYNKFCENQDKIVNNLSHKKALSPSMILFLKEELLGVQKNNQLMFRSVVNQKLVAVRDDYFDKFIFEFLDEKPKPCMVVIGEIFGKFGRLSVTFDQIIIRLWMLLRDGIIERVATNTKYGLFFEYMYKLSDHINMQRD